MKNKLWLWQLPWVFLFTFAFVVTEAGVDGNLDNDYLRNAVFQKARNFSHFFTDWKFKLRGPREPKNKIVVVEIDSQSLDVSTGGIGRWPWHRDVIADLVEKIFDAGAKVVGLDITFSEMDPRLPLEAFDFLKSLHVPDEQLQSYETDFKLAHTIEKYRDRLVLGTAYDGFCQPRYDKSENCPIGHPELVVAPNDYSKFGFKSVKFEPGFDAKNTPVFSLLSMIPNIDLYNVPALHAGFFNAEPDGDGYIRRTPLVVLADAVPYPFLSVEMAKIGFQDEFSLQFGADSKLKKFSLEKAGTVFPVNGLGIAEINFRGPGRTFPYVSVMELLRNNEEQFKEDGPNRKLAGIKKSDIFKDAYVLVGPTALGIYDMRAFPFDQNVAGVEGHATILDNILSNDFLKRGVGGTYNEIWLILLMTFGALAFAYVTEKLNAIPALVLFILVFSGIGFVDVRIFFEHNVNWETSFLYTEIFTIFVFILAMKYVLEEKSKKAVQANWALYVSPALVDAIVKDPNKVSLGSEKKNLTIMFSDVRSFTSFSERMDAKALSAFLSDYLGMMTEVVYSTQGTLDKYIGDAIMAFWGAPLDHPKHAAAACDTAIKMMKVLEENRARYLKETGVDVQIGIGINTGNVAVGNMGSKKNRAYTVIGDDVNLASRLEGLTKYYGVHILTTRFTLNEIEASGEPLPRHRVLDFVKVKGKKKAVEMIEIIDRNLPDPALELFQQGRALYAQQKWDEAAAKFQAADTAVFEAIHEGDGPSREFLQRCTDFKANSPGADWDGSWEMHSK